MASLSSSPQVVKLSIIPNAMDDEAVERRGGWFSQAAIKV